MASNTQLTQAAMLSGPGQPHCNYTESDLLTNINAGKLAAVTSLVDKLTQDLGSGTLTPQGKIRTH